MALVRRFLRDPWLHTPRGNQFEAVTKALDDHRRDAGKTAILTFLMFDSPKENTADPDR